MEPTEKPRSPIFWASLFVAIAFGLLAFSIRSAKVADMGSDGFHAVEDDQLHSAPDWALRDAKTGQIVRLSEQSKKGPVVFSFWATWCEPCRMEMPHLQRLSKKYSGRVQFYGINSNDPATVLTPFAREAHVTYPMLSDASHEVAARYGVDAIPLLVVVDQHGKIRGISSGYSDSMENNLSGLLDSLLLHS